jgi:hypothetical protein
MLKSKTISVHDINRLVNKKKFLLKDKFQILGSCQRSEANWLILIFRVGLRIGKGHQQQTGKYHVR